VGLWEFISSRRSEIIDDAVLHASLVAQAMLIAAVIGTLIAVAVYHNPRAARVALGSSSVMLTIPSFALLGLLIPTFGLGVPPTMIALVLYALLPIIRNGVVGLNSVDPAVVDSARGMGMSRVRTLLQVEMPLAWPVVLTGIRVATQLIMGIAAIAAFVQGPGLGRLIFDGLSHFGAVNSVESAFVGTAGVLLLAVLFDLAYVVIGRLTTSKGLRV